MNLKIVDFFIGSFSAATMAYIIHLIVEPGFNMFLGMIVGGIIGMALMMLIMVLLMPFFGAFEVMIPLHINAMLVGMSAGMLSTLPAITSMDITAGGALAGLVISIFIYLSNRNLTTKNQAL